MVFLIIHEYSLGTMFQNQNLQITFSGFTSIRPKEDDFFHSRTKNFTRKFKISCSGDVLKKNEFFTNLAILIGCRLFNWITTNDHEKIWKCPRKDDFWSKMFKSTKMFKVSSNFSRISRLCNFAENFVQISFAKYAHYFRAKIFHSLLFEVISRVGTVNFFDQKELIWGHFSTRKKKVKVNVIANPFMTLKWP